MLGGEAIVYVLSSTAFPIFNIYSVVVENKANTSAGIAVLGFLGFLCPDFLVSINPCATFYVYLCASQRFRNICKHLILFKWRGNNQVQIRTGVDQKRITTGNHLTHSTNNRKDGEQFFNDA